MPNIEQVNEAMTGARLQRSQPAIDEGVRHVRRAAIVVPVGTRLALFLGTIGAATLLQIPKSAMSGAPSQGAVEEMIEGLASPNRKPTWPDGDVRSRPLYPAGYDQSAQETILHRWDALLSRGAAAFPGLIASLDDPRYSCTMRQDVWINLSVGEVCYRILESQVSICSRFMRREDRGRYVPSWIVAEQAAEERRSSAIQRWWLKRKGETLLTLQLEGTLWAVAYEQKKSFDEKKEEQATALNGLDRLRNRLMSSNEPIRVDRNGQFLGRDKNLDPRYVPSVDPAKRAKAEDPFTPR